MPLVQEINSGDDLLAYQAQLRETLCAGGTIGMALGITEQECEALYQFGHGFYAQGRYSEAFQVFSTLVGYDHLEPRYLVALAAAAQMLGRYEDALQHYGTAALLTLDDPAPLVHSAECCLALGQHEGAVEALELAIELIDQEPRHEALRPRVEALLESLNHPQAV